MRISLIILLMGAACLAADEFESICVTAGHGTTPSGDTWTEDQVYVVVKRTINGSTVRTIEQFTPLQWDADLSDPTYCWFVDCAARGSNRYQPGAPASGVAGVPGEYPTLRAATDQADPGLTQTTAIANKTDLQNMQSNLAGNYYLTADIDCSGGAFTPVTVFTGTLDGCGYTISNLDVDRGANDRAGLFGQISGTGKVANLTITGATLTCDDYCGILAGDVVATATDEPLIQNVTVSGTLTAGTSAGSKVWYGGLIGYCIGHAASGNQVYVYDCSANVTLDGTDRQTRNWGGLIGDMTYTTVGNCSATGNITGGTTASDWHGGFAGKVDTSSTVTDSSATGDVDCDLECGGFAGAISDTAVVRRCSATGDVSGDNQEIAGFVGVNEGDIYDCYAWGAVTGGVAAFDLGGFVGQGNNALDIYQQCYSIGAVTGGSGVAQGGFAGSGAGVGQDCYWDTQTSSQATSDGDFEETGQTTAWLKNKTNFPATWDYDTIWYNPYTEDTTIPAVPEAWSDDEATPLDGETVCVYADGIPRGEYVMDGNDIVGFAEESYDVVIAGLNYWSIYETTRLYSSERERGRTDLMKHRVSNVNVDFWRSTGADIGVDRTNKSTIQFSSDSWATAMEPFTGYKAPILFPRGMSRDLTIYIEEWDPIPMNIRGIFINLETYD